MSTLPYSRPVSEPEPYTRPTDRRDRYDRPASGSTTTPDLQLRPGAGQGDPSTLIGTGTTSSGGGSTGTTATMERREQEARDFFADARILYPWMPDELLRIFADAWAASGDPALALATMRSSEAYERWFPANRREDGTFRYTEQEYFAARRGMEMLLSDYGQDPSGYADRIVAAMGGEVSVQEFGERLQLLWSDVMQQIPQIRQAYVTEFGLSDVDPAVSDSNLFASFLNPGASLQELRVRTGQAGIVGQAAAYGFNRGFGRADELRRAGLDAAGARNLYQQAALQVPTLSALSARYYDTADPFDLDDFEDALTGLDPSEQEHARRLVQFERSSFTERGQIMRGQTGGLSGLQQQ